MQKHILNIKSKFFRSVFVLFMLAIASVSCDSNRFYEYNEAIENNVWCYEDAKVFEVNIEDSVTVFNFYINVRNTVDYEFANIYFFIQSELPNGVIAKDTVECQLADYQGKWLGNGRGEFRDNSFILRQNMRFQHSGKYLFTLKQGMRRDSLKGIADVGIRLEYVD